MDLRITITDEDDAVLMDRLTIYQDGSDAAGVGRIKHWLVNTFSVENEPNIASDLDTLRDAIDCTDTPAWEALDRVGMAALKTN